MKFLEDLIHLNKTNRLKIIVIGDVAIDDYKFGKVTRISPEFPVQILKSDSFNGDLQPGCASNVCHQMTHFNVETFLLGFVDDSTRSTLKNLPFNMEYCVPLVEGKNPTKIRFYDENFPLLRWDIEQPNYGESKKTLKNLRDKLFENFLKLTKNKIDVVILSDYHKGLWDQSLAKKIIQKCNEEKIITIVDPKNPPLNQWENCSYFKPNSIEAKNLTGIADPVKQCEKIKSKLNCKGTVITQEGKGMIGMEKQSFTYEELNPIPSEKVNSKIGAGDAFISTLAVCLGHQIPFEPACELAFKAGSKYVQAKHNKPINIFDIKQISNPIAAKFVNPEDLAVRDYKLSSTGGCFDLFHCGHLESLKFAKSKGDKLVVMVNSDKSVARLKPGRPFVSLENRMNLLAALECVDFVVSFDEDTPLEIIKKIQPDILIKGSEYQTDNIVGKEFVKEVVTCPMVEGLSTSRLVEKIKSQI